MTNFDKLNSFTAVSKLRDEYNPIVSVDNIQSQRADSAGLSLFYATTFLKSQDISILAQLANEAGVFASFDRLLSEEIMNLSEKRKVLHHKTRDPNYKGLYSEEKLRFCKFAEDVHNGKILTSTGEKFENVVQIGIGGSDLGPRAIVDGILRYYEFEKGKLLLQPYFISNVDPDDANYVLSKLNIKKTLFIAVSKSGTTQETLANLEFVKRKSGLTDNELKKHFIAVTGKGSPMDDLSKYLASFYIDDNIGGRYSVTSAVGGVLLSLVFGTEIFQEFLDGAYAMDIASKEKDLKKNMPLVDALIGVFYRNFLQYQSLGVIPYSVALRNFGLHLQQLDCESNGKLTNANNEPLNYQTGPMIFSGIGTDSQHSFFQRMHQGTDIVPLQFIIARKPQIINDIETFGSTSQKKLIANQLAQMIALAVGNKSEGFPGGRPSSLICYDRLTPKILGALLSHYENKVMFQGFLWNLNSFDQPGVQLGKVIAQKILDKKNLDQVTSKLLEVIYE